MNYYFVVFFSFFPFISKPIRFPSFVFQKKSTTKNLNKSSGEEEKKL